MKVVIKIISYIFAFILMLALLISILLELAIQTVLNKDYVLIKLNETNYYQKAYSSLISQVEDYAEQSGLDEIDIGNVITREQVEADINNLFTKLYTGETDSIIQEDIVNQLQENLNEELEQNSITLTATEEKALEKIVDNLAEGYASEICYGTYSEYLGYVSKIILFVDEGLPIPALTIYALTFIIAVFILAFNYHQFRIGLRYIGISLVASGGILIGANAFINNSLNIQNFYIFNRATSDLIINIVSDFLGKINLAGIITVLVGVLFIIVGATYSKKYNKKH